MTSMNRFLFLALFAVAACAAAFAIAPLPAEAAAKQSAKSGYHPLKGTIYYKHRRVGGYSYKYVDAIDTRRFVDPSLSMQSNGGPFDSGFFFSTPYPPHGGDAPYMH